MGHFLGNFRKITTHWCRIFPWNKDFDYPICSATWKHPAVNHPKCDKKSYIRVTVWTSAGSSTSGSSTSGWCLFVVHHVVPTRHGVSSAGVKLDDAGNLDSSNVIQDNVSFVCNWDKFILSERLMYISALWSNCQHSYSQMITWVENRTVPILHIRPNMYAKNLQFSICTFEI